jgi:hypothetical protein
LLVGHGLVIQTVGGHFILANAERAVLAVVRAVDIVRRAESKALRADGDETLTGSRSEASPHPGRSQQAENGAKILVLA